MREGEHFTYSSTVDTKGTSTKQDHLLPIGAGVIYLNMSTLINDNTQTGEALALLKCFDHSSDVH
jgi:hypothetical protein